MHTSTPALSLIASLAATALSQQVQATTLSQLISVSSNFGGPTHPSALLPNWNRGGEPVVVVVVVNAAETCDASVQFGGISDAKWLSSSPRQTLTA
jgi:hypothetical protein